MIVRLAFLGAALLAAGVLPALAQSSQMQNTPMHTDTGDPVTGSSVAPSTPANHNPSINPNAAGTQLRHPNETPLSGPSTAPPNMALKPADKNSMPAETAQKRLEEQGYRSVSGLHLDQSKIWQGNAIKDGRHVRVGIDAFGNIAEER